MIFKTPETSMSIKLLMAHLSLWLERILLSCEWLVLWIGIFISLTLFGLKSNIFSSIFWVIFLVLAFIAIKKFQRPSPLDIKERLERDSNVLHRPLRSQDDTPATVLSPTSKKLWYLEIARKSRQLAHLVWVKPRFGLAQRDPYALRIAIILALCIGFVISGSAAPSKIASALFPFRSAPQEGSASGSALQIVITSPAYTRQPKIVLSSQPNKPVQVYQGSKIRAARLSSLGHTKVIMGDVIIPLVEDGETNASIAEAIIPEAHTLKITQFGFPLLKIPLQYIKDEPPALTLRGDPEMLGGGQILLPLSVQDDYGLKLVRLRAILSPNIKKIPLGNPVFVEKTIITGTSREGVEINPRFDLTGHPWAGYPVSLLIEGEDHAEQTSTIEPIELILPERKFKHPVSRNIIEARRFLIQNGEIAAGASALKLAEILGRPQLYQWDEKVTLALRSSMSRLAYDPTREAAETVISTLWETALRLEDGNLASSQAGLREALENLQSAVQEKRNPEEISRLLSAFYEALAQHIQNIQKAQKGMESPPSGLTMEMLDPAMLKDFLSQLAEDLMGSDIESAMEKLEALQKMTDMLDSSLAQPLPEDIKQMMKDTQSLQKIIDAQQALLSQTRALRDKNSQAEKKLQEKIKDHLASIESGAEINAPKAVETLKKSGAFMQESEIKLAANAPDLSEPYQQQALDALKQGKKSLQQSLQQRLQKMMGFMAGGTQQSHDPLGQSSGNNGKNMLNSKVKLPTEAERKKADDILKTIREKSSDLSRPQAEREYYQRLLRQW